MPVYTVHEPRKLTGNPVRDAERFQFVRDGFHFWAFLLGPIWMLFRRMWLVFLIYTIVMIGIQYGLTKLGVSGAVNFFVGLMIAVLVGFEAGTLTQYLTYGLQAAGFEVVCLEARQVSVTLAAMRNKTDRNDARGWRRSSEPVGTARFM